MASRSTSSQAQGRRRGRRRVDKRGTRPRPDRRIAAAAPRPSARRGAQSDELEKRRLARDLVACGLLKADADWDDKHPRTGAPPNPGWFAPTAGAAAADEPKTELAPRGGRAVVAAARRSPLFRARAGGRRWSRCSPKTCPRPPCAGWRHWPPASPPRRSCSTRSSCRATTGSSRRAASPAVPTSPIAGRTTKAQPR